MRENDFDEFLDMLNAVADLHNKPQSKFAISLWWGALEPYSLPAVRDALSRHVRSPDNGQFMPKPADLVKLIEGTTVDTALVAWAKVDKAVRQIGTWHDVVFDDALIHRVVQDMGGWLGFGTRNEAEWPFVAKEFENRYRGYRTRADKLPHPPVLIGAFNTQNGQLGAPATPPVLIGNAERANAVMLGGSIAQVIGLHRPEEYKALGAGNTSENVLQINFNQKGKVA